MVNLDDRKDGVLVVTLDRPPANALRNEDIETLIGIFGGGRGVGDTPAVVLTGAGSRFFCPGGDIKELDDHDEGFALRRMELFHVLLVAMEAYPRPVCAAVNGYAVGGGLELVMFADIVIASPHVRFGFPEINHGVLPAAKGVRRTVQRIGHSGARRLLLTGEIVECESDDGRLLVDRVVPAEELMSDAVGAAAAAAAKPAELYASLKTAIHRTEGWSDDALAELTERDIRSYFDSDAARAARQAWRS